MAGPPSIVKCLCMRINIFWEAGFRGACSATFSGPGVLIFSMYVYMYMVWDPFDCKIFMYAYIYIYGLGPERKIVYVCIYIYGLGPLR